MTALNFPKDRTGLVPPGTGPLQNGDIWNAPTGVQYKWNSAGSYWSATFQNDGIDKLEETFLRLDAANAPLLGNLTIGAANQITLETSGSAEFAGEVRVDASGGEGLQLTSNAVVNNNPINGSGIIVGTASVRPAIATGVPDTSGSISFGTSTNPWGSAVFAGGVTADNITLAGPIRASGGIEAFGPTGSYKIFAGGVAPSDENVTILGNGSATFAGDFFTFGDLNFQSPATAQSGVAFRYGSIMAKRDDNSDFVIWSGRNVAGDETSAIYGTGSAEFAGGYGSTGGGFSIQSNGELRSNGQITTNSPTASTAVAYSVQVGGTQQTGINYDGSAEFGGDVHVGGNPNQGTEVGSRLWTDGRVQACRASGSGEVWAAFVEGTAAPTSQILADGSASFTGVVDSSSYDTAGGSPSYQLVPTGLFQVTGTTGEAAIRVFPQGAGNQNPSAIISTDGSATFLGRVLSNRTTAGFSAFTAQLNGTSTADIFADGSAKFVGEIRYEGSGDNYGLVVNKTGGNSKGIYIGTASTTDNSDLITAQSGYGGDGVVDRFTVKADGSAEFAGGVEIGGTSDLPNIRLNQDGSGCLFTGRNDCFTNINATSGSERYFSLGQSVDGTRVVNIKLDQIGGRAEFAGGITKISETGRVDVGAYDASSDSGQGLIMSYSDSVGFGTYGVQAKSTISSASSRSLFIGRLGKTAVFDLKADGSADFAGNIQSGGDPTDGANKGFKVSGGSVTITRPNTYAAFTVFAENNSNSKILFTSDGSAKFAGNIDAGNVFFNLEPDNDANYTTTTDAEGNEVSVYNGPTLDVKDRLSKADAALQALKTAAAAAADFAALKAAITTALADI